MLPANGENAPISSIASALAKDHSSRPTLRSAAIGFWKMPKLCRAPMPMVRITAPQITAIQKLRCCGWGADWAGAIDMEGPLMDRQLVTCIMIVTALYPVNAAKEL